MKRAALILLVLFGGCQSMDRRESSDQAGQEVPPPPLPPRISPPPPPPPPPPLPAARDAEREDGEEALSERLIISPSTDELSPAAFRDLQRICAEASSQGRLGCGEAVRRAFGYETLSAEERSAIDEALAALFAPATRTDAELAGDADNMVLAPLPEPISTAARPWGHLEVVWGRLVQNRPDLIRLIARPVAVAAETDRRFRLAAIADPMKFVLRDLTGGVHVQGPERWQPLGRNAAEPINFTMDFTPRNAGEQRLELSLYLPDDARHILRKELALSVEPAEKEDASDTDIVANPDGGSAPDGPEQGADEPFFGRIEILLGAVLGILTLLVAIRDKLKELLAGLLPGSRAGEAANV